MVRVSSGLETEVRDHAQTYGRAAVSTNDRDGDRRSQSGVSQLLGDENRSAVDIQSSGTKEPEMGIGSVSR